MGGSPPCTPYSQAGPQLGREHQHAKLSKWLIVIADILGAEDKVGEQVIPFFEQANLEGWYEMLQFAREFGYDGRWTKYKLHDFLPQRRQREVFWLSKATDN